MTDDQLAARIIKDIRTKKSAFWEKKREECALALFHRVAREVPAYADFLKKNRVNPANIKTFRDFGEVPSTSKKNYLREYPLEKVMKRGALGFPLTWSATSGSTGEPFYFPRSRRLDWEYSILAEMHLVNNGRGVKGPTLVMVCLGMGVWIAGVLNYESFKMAAERGGYPVSIITPGINKTEIFKALKGLAPQFAQTILIGYPPFLKDIVDEAPLAGVDLKKLHIRFLSGAETFTEHFRDYLVRQAHTENPHTDTLNVYGSADIGSMAFETPTAILVRRLTLRHEEIFEDLFPGIRRTPTLTQYNPLFVTFEATQEGEILLSGASAIPLVRYAIGDNGGVFSSEHLMRIFRKHGIDLVKEARNAKIGPLSHLPFVYVYERSDSAISLYGLKIYPEPVREALLDQSLTPFLTGKFAMEAKFDGRENQYWQVNLELRRGKKESRALGAKAIHTIIDRLRRNNSEFRELAAHLGKRALPKIVLWPYESPEYFRPGGKQKWIVAPKGGGPLPRRSR